MAFEGSSKLYQCWMCWKSHTWMQMLEHEVPREETSNAAASTDMKWHAIEIHKETDQQLQLVRSEPEITSMTSQQREIPARFGPDDDEQKWPYSARVCPDCVLQDRIKQWPQKSAYWQEAHPEWATPQGVKRDMRRQNKGRLWNQSGKHIQQAKIELKSGNGLENSLTRNRRKQEIIKRSHQLAQALLDSLNSGNLLTAFRNAGARMMGDSVVGQSYMEAYNKAMLEESDEEAQEDLEKAEK